MMGGWAANGKTDKRSFGVFQRRLGSLALCARGFREKGQQGLDVRIGGMVNRTSGTICKYIRSFNLFNIMYLCPRVSLLNVRTSLAWKISEGTL